MDDARFHDDWEFLESLGEHFASEYRDALLPDTSPTISSLGSSLDYPHGDTDMASDSIQTPYLSFAPDTIEPMSLPQRFDYGPSLFEYIPKNPAVPLDVQPELWFLSPTCSDAPVFQPEYTEVSPAVVTQPEAVELPLAAPAPTRPSTRASLSTPHPQSQIDKFLSTYFQDVTHHRLWQTLQSILTSPWFLSDAPEPAGISKRSIFLHFLLHQAHEPVYQCLFDGCHASFPRQDRALGHVRKHLNYRPFACTGPCAARGCKTRFSCRSYLRTHLTRQKVPCKACKARIFPQNMTRHLKTCPLSRV